MKQLITAIIFIIFSVSTSLGQSFRIDIKGELKGSSDLDIFHAQTLVPSGQSREIFTGPYSLKLTPAKSDSAQYVLQVSAYGLAPNYHNEDFNLPISLYDPMIIPPLPVKNGAQALYTFTLLDDTSTIVSEPDQSDSTKWGTSETVHYVTHWQKGSLADFLWNVKMGYLEDIYNKYRASYDLSSFEKIDLYLHPEPVNSIYLDPKSYYAIQPRLRRIDLVYGHDIDALDPRPGAELQIYRMWGYGPRWMVTGFAGYYFDNDLRVKDYINKFSVKKITAILADESQVDSDTGREIAGAFVHWLTDTQSIGKFINLYKQSTSLDYATNFNQIYGQSLDKTIAEFIDYSKKFSPDATELNYYASIYIAQGDYHQAANYYQKLFDRKDKNSGAALQPLYMCMFWYGDYAGADKLLKASKTSGDQNSYDDYMAVKISMANGDLSQKELSSYQDLANKNNVLAKIELASILLDNGKTDSASTVIDEIAEIDKTSPDFFLAAARLRIMKGLPADSILTFVAANAINSAGAAPQDPSFYLTAGRALMLLGKYDDAKTDLETSLFLERRPYFIGQTLLELGRLMDLQGKRDEAKGYYDSVIKMNSGAYEKSLAKRYLENNYVVK